ncbi:MAG: hypothetical protein HQ565_05055 [Bacteroidetes bacterium]|nr:hypothetical protein [Bacteroidota bacterium]
MKKFFLSIYIFIGLSLEFLAEKIGAVKHLDYLDMPRFSEIDNMGGTGTKFYYALAKDITEWPVLPDPETALDISELQELSGAFTMATGTKFFVGYMTPDTGSIANADQGDIDGVSQKHTFKLFHPKMNKTLLGFIRATNNQGMVFIVPDSNGVNFMVGSEAFPALKSPDGESGTGEGTAGRSGAGLSFTSYGPGPAPIVPEAVTIPLTPAV